MCGTHRKCEGLTLGVMWCRMVFGTRCAEWAMSTFNQTVTAECHRVQSVSRFSGDPRMPTQQNKKKKQLNMNTHTKRHHFVACIFQFVQLQSYDVEIDANAKNSALMSHKRSKRTLSILTNPDKNYCLPQNLYLLDQDKCFLIVMSC